VTYPADDAGEYYGRLTMQSRGLTECF